MTGPYVSPRSTGDSHAPLACLYAEYDPSEYFAPHGVPVTFGMWLYGIEPDSSRSEPATLAYPTSITLEDQKLRPARKPIAKTASPATSQTGQRVVYDARRARPQPIATSRTNR